MATEKDFARLEELIEMSMRLARTAARHALQEDTVPEAEKTARFRSGGHGAFFVRLCRSVRTLTALKCRLEAGLLPAPLRKAAQLPAVPRAEPRPPPADPRLAPIMDYLLEVMPAAPHVFFHPEISDSIEQRIHEHLAADPEQHRPGSEIVVKICEEWNIPYDLLQMANDLIFPPPKPGYEAHAPQRETAEWSDPDTHDPSVG